MFRFAQLIRRDIICDVQQRHPGTVPFFDQLRFRPVCDHCDIETIAPKNEFNFPDVVKR
jgi:hypothetical protein